MSTKKLQSFEYEGRRITFDFENGQTMVNATEMSKVFGKLPGNFLRLKQTKDFIKILETRYSDVNIGNDYKALRVIKGGNQKELQGTWMDEKLALKFAAWLNPLFELWVYDRIYELLTTGQTALDAEQLLEFERMKKREKQAQFYLNKIFNNALENSQYSKFLFDGQQLDEENE